MFQLRSHMRNFYDFAFEMRYRASLPWRLKWIREVIRFFQFVFFTLDFSKIAEINTRSITLLRALNNAGLLNSCFDIAHIPIKETSFTLVAVILLYLHIYINSIRAKNGKYVSKNAFFVVTSMFEFIMPVYQIHMFFAFSQQCMQLHHYMNLRSFVAFLLHTISLAFFAQIDYMMSVFVRPRIFIYYSLLDSHTGVMDIANFWMRFLAVTTQINLAQSNHAIVLIAGFLAYPIVLFIYLEARISMGVHISVIGVISQDAILFAQPFVWLYHLYPCKFLTPVIVLILSMALYTCIYLAYQFIMGKYAFLILNEKYVPPWWFPIKSSLVMRITAQTKADIEGLENFMYLRINHSQEEIIEAVRFLGIFKNQRQKILLMLSMTKTQNPYYEYQFYLYSRLFKSIEGSAPQHYVANLDDLHRRYLVCLSLFWKERYQKNFMKSFIYGTQASLTHIDLINFIKYLCFIYQSDPYIYQSYAEILLIAQGEPAKSVTYRRYANFLKENRVAPVDPIFKWTASYYPLSIDVYSEEKSASHSDDDSSSAQTDNALKDNQVRFHVDENIIFRNEEMDNSLIAMFVQKSNSMVSMNILVSCIIVLIWFGFYMREITNNEKYSVFMLSDIKNLVKSTMELSLQLTAGVIMQPTFSKTEVIPFECDEVKREIYKFIFRYSFSYGDDFAFKARALSQASDFLAKSTGQECLDLLNASKIIYNSLSGIQLNFMYINENISHMLANTRILTTYNKFLFILIICAIMTSIFSAFMGYLSIRFTMSEMPDEAVQFLGSKERLSMLLLKKSLESWDLFRLIFHNEKNTQMINKPINYNQKRIKLGKSDSDNQFSLPKSPNKSHHVNLKDSKVAISFLGNDQILKPSQFALMSPFIHQATARYSSDASEEMFDLTNDSKDEDIRVEPESVENLDLVSETIENTKFSGKKGIRSIMISHLLPWIITMAIVLHARVVLQYMFNHNSSFLEKFIDNITNIHTLPYQLITNMPNTLSTANIEHLHHNLSFYFRSLEPFLEDTDKINSSSMIGLVSYSIITGLLWFLLNIAVFKVESFIMIGFDSLFHFPTGYVESLKKPLIDDDDCKLPNNIIEVTLANESNYIIDVSHQSTELIGIEPIDMIGRKYDDVFQINSDHERAFTISHKKVKKFIESIYSLTKITRIALYDNTSDNPSKNSLAIVLGKFIPSQIAAIFCNNGMKEIILEKAFIIIARFNSMEFNTPVDQIFFASKNLLQYYSSIYLLKCEGSLIYFLYTGHDRNVLLLFCRDFIAASKPSGRNRDVNQNALLNILVLKSKLSAVVDISNEPYVSISYTHVNESRKAIFAQKAKTIFFVENSIHTMPENENSDVVNLIPGTSGKIVDFENIDHIIEILQ